MGYKLRREVRDALPPGLLTAAERGLVLEIADECNDATREGWPGVELLVRRADLSPRTIQEALNRIGKKWIELRVALGTDKHGRPFYSHAGKRTTFRFPQFPKQQEGATDPGASAEEGAMDPGAFEQEGAMDPGASEQKGATDPGLRCDRSGGLSLKDPLKNSLSPREESRTEREKISEGQKNRTTQSHRAVARLGVPDDLVEPVVAWLTRQHRIASPGWWIAASKNGSLADRVGEAVAALKQAAAPPAARAGGGVDQEECGKHEGGLGPTASGVIRCGFCRREAEQAARGGTDTSAPATRLAEVISLSDRRVS
ncbi:hypothetical protein [Micromonospora chalcea]|uniref:hypothetical protein n=1 Tax=Micromonospora chalcea TaxID=1874 RepID=UPI003D70704C